MHLAVKPNNEVTGDPNHEVAGAPDPSNQKRVFFNFSLNENLMRVGANLKYKHKQLIYRHSQSHREGRPGPFGVPNLKVVGAPSLPTNKKNIFKLL